MAKVSINLLPPEIINKELKKTNFYKIELVGIVVILIFILLAFLTVALRFLQDRKIKQVQAKISQTKQRISDLKETQATLFLLKNKLTVIDKYFGIPSNQSLMYKLVDNLVPPDVAMNTIIVNKAGEVSLLALVPDALSLDNFIDNLTMKEKNEEKIKQVGIESLNRGRDQLYRINFTIKPK